jgi:predicted metal-binding membrane protein
MAGYFEAEFGAGVTVGVGATGLAVALTDSGPTNWLFVVGAIVAMAAGLGAYYMLKVSCKEQAESF